MQSRVIADDLYVPWALAFLPDSNWLIVTERNGRVQLINWQSLARLVLTDRFLDTVELGEGGLLGVALHPNFPSNRFVYFYHTYRDSQGEAWNRVVRVQLEMRSEHPQLINPRTLLDRIP